MNVSSEYIPQITKIFSKKIIKEILSTNKSDLLNEIVINSKIEIKENFSYIDIYNYFYNLLINEYQNEYVYKNEFLLQLIKKEYKTEHVFLQEVPIFNNIVDLLVINGKTTAYEIKTEYDSLQRLESQLDSYSKVFDNIFIITSEKHLEKINNFLKNNYTYVGILIFSKKTIKLIKKASANPNISLNAYEQILTNTELNNYSITFDEIKKMDEKKGFKICREILKNRQKNGSSVINHLPDSIKSLVSSIHLVDWQKKRILQKLSMDINI